MSTEIEFEVRVLEQVMNGKPGEEVGKSKQVKFKKHEVKKDEKPSVSIGSQCIREVEHENNRLKGKTTVVVEDPDAHKQTEYEMSVEIILDHDSRPPTITTVFRYWGERFKEVDEISQEDLKNLVQLLEAGQV